MVRKRLSLQQTTSPLTTMLLRQIVASRGHEKAVAAAALCFISQLNYISASFLHRRIATAKTQVKYWDRETTVRAVEIDTNANLRPPSIRLLTTAI